NTHNSNPSQQVPQTGAGGTRRPRVNGAAGTTLANGGAQTPATPSSQQQGLLHTNYVLTPPRG
ncbi:unnamed protein product, partial [Amoebophrya sp. A120]